jgi:hypothetical protein
MIFPLPLTPFEEYMLADDRPQWPMTFFLRLELRGQYDPAILTSALTAALARHPLLASLLADGGGGGLQWVAGPGVPPPVSFAGAGCELDFPEGRQIDLRRKIGVRVWVRSDGADEWALWVQFHHACCDGLGAMQFVGDVLAAYASAGQKTASGSSRPVLDPERLRRRADFRLISFRTLLRLPQEFLGFLGVIEFFSHRPPGLTAANASDATRTIPATAEFPVWIDHRFGPEQTERLWQAARAANVTLNDLLLANLFSATDDWFAVHRAAARQQFLRMMVPTNLRSAADRQTPAANIVSMVNLDRRPIRYASPRRLLKSISLEMAIIKRCRLGITMHHVVGLARRLGKLAWLLPDDGCLSTCVLSNLGDVSAAVEPAVDSRLELVSLNFLPPVRLGTAAAFGISTHRGCTTITLHYDSSLSAEAARELLDKFVARLDDHCVGLPVALSNASI